MNALSVGSSEKREAVRAGIEGEVGRRKASLLAILSAGIPTLPNPLLQLDVLLASTPVDLAEVSSFVRSDPGLRAQLLWLCKSALYGLRQPPSGVEEAAILTGIERLRKLVMACHLIRISFERLAKEQADLFWTHSLLTAMLSERLGHRLNLENTDQAYVGGLLHDVGKLPLVMVTKEENSSGAVWLRGNGEGSLGVEREYFCLDHCEVGRWLAINWNFSPALVEVIESHHRPEQVRFAPMLVGIVAAADHFCEQMDAGMPRGGTKGDKFYRLCLPWLSEPGCASVLDLLHREYPLMRKQLGSGVPHACAGG